jgi:signal transduction histidine kinase
MTGVTADITGRKIAEQSLATINEELERRIEEKTRERELALAQLFEAQKMESIGHLTGGVAHDFNNLLMAISGSLEIARKRLTDPRTRHLVDNAIESTMRGAALTKRLLAFARRQELNPTPTDVAILVEGVRDLLCRAIGPAVQLTASIPHSLPAIKVDPNQLELALLNLAVNARDAMPDGGDLHISAECVHAPLSGCDGLKAGDYVCVALLDSGIGMDEATLARAAEPFFTTKGPGKGTGLGLSMVHGMAAQSGGALQLSSAPGGGTVARLFLPTALEKPTNLRTRIKCPHKLTCSSSEYWSSTMTRSCGPEPRPCLRIPGIRSLRRNQVRRVFACSRKTKRSIS